MADPTPKVDLFISGAWVTVTTKVTAESVRINQGRTPGAIQAESARLTCVIIDDNGWLAEGNPLSPWYPDAGRGCLIRVSQTIAGVDWERFTGRINTMVAVYPLPGFARVTITATGTLSQIGQGSDPLRPALLRSQLANSPLAAWPLGDGASASQAADASTGGQPMLPVGADAVFTTTTGPAGGPALVVALDATTGLRAQVNGTSTTWTAETAVNVRNTQAGSWLTVRGVAPWQFDLFPTVTPVTSLVLRAVGPASFLDSFTATGPAGTVLDDGNWHHVGFRITQSGANIAAVVTIDGVETSGTFVGGTATPMRAVGVNDTTFDPPLAVGAWSAAAVYDSAVSLTGRYQALLGYAGELAHVRFARLCSEQGITATVYGSTSAVMGPQLRDTLGANLQDCEDVDHGLLHDGGAAGAVVYMCNDYLTDKAVGLTIPKGALADGLAPIWDNQLTVNDVTSSRPSGSSARISDEAHVVKVKRRIPRSPSVNVQTDDQLPYDAGWIVWVGTAAGPRYEAVGINGHSTAGAAIAASLAGIAIGSRLAVAEASLPTQHPPGGMDTLVVGWVETLDPVSWTLAPLVAPYAPYLVCELADTLGDTNPYLGWSIPDTCTLNTGVNATATSWLVDSDPLWSTDADDYPAAIVIDGEPITVTAVAGAATPQTWTVTRHATLAKTHSAAAVIEQAHPLILTIA